MLNNHNYFSVQGTSATAVFRLKQRLDSNFDDDGSTPVKARCGYYTDAAGQV
jgi:hypothetical protein